MSARHFVQLLCDFGEDCEADTGSWANASVSRDWAAKHYGWTTTQNIDGVTLDFCPEHSASAHPVGADTDEG